MAYQTVFKRYELKFMLTDGQKARLMAVMEPHMVPDEYGPGSVRNLYFDTDSFRLIRRSIEKPVYKEKLRIRSYGQAAPGSTVFVELKKKYRSVVYKRRLSMEEREAMAWLAEGTGVAPDSQIGREICYFLRHYGPLRPTVALSYDREAYCPREGGDFRMTFDRNIRCRLDRLTLTADAGGEPLLPEGRVLMEVKCSGGIPLWLTRFLTEEKIRRTSFSKYGTAYQTMIHPCRTGGIYHD